MIPTLLTHLAPLAVGAGLLGGLELWSRQFRVVKDRTAFPDGE